MNNNHSTKTRRYRSGCSEMETVNISVREPVSFSPYPFTSFTSYTIYIETSHPAFSAKKSSSRRRFSEFRWLRRQLWRHFPQRKPPELPPVGVIVWNKFSDAFLEERRIGLQRFLREVVCVPAYLGEKVLHLFAQTELPIKDIEANLTGHRDDSVSALCRYWPAAPLNQDNKEEEVVTSPCDIVPSPSLNYMANCSVTSDASSFGYEEHWSSAPSGRRTSCRLPSNHHGGLSSSLIC